MLSATCHGGAVRLEIARRRTNCNRSICRRLGTPVIGHVPTRLLEGADRWKSAISDDRPGRG